MFQISKIEKDYHCKSRLLIPEEEHLKEPLEPQNEENFQDLTICWIVKKNSKVLTL